MRFRKRGIFFMLLFCEMETSRKIDVDVDVLIEYNK